VNFTFYLHKVKEDRNILRAVKGRKVNWIGYILSGNWLLKHVIEGKVEGRIEVTGRRGRRRKKLLDELKKETGYRKWSLLACYKNEHKEGRLTGLVTSCVGTAF
jgi:hypothetical protein